LIFFLVAPGVVAGLLPWLLTDWEFRKPLPLWLPVRVMGAALVVAGIGALVHAFGRFVREGMGTPAPVAPTEQLVIGGLYRYVRNPMYVAVLAVILGQALIFGQAVLLPYAAAAFLAMAAFARGYEEPRLSRQFGVAYEEYRRNVPGWWPRRRPWQPQAPE
jgi:protein-S-isoprenylcysteine O-methyltransferase Ste14